MRATARVRPEERQDAWAAFAMLFGLIASHSVLETARDALFLSSIAPERLPWVYIGIAGVSLVITQVQARVSRGLERRRALTLWTGAAAGVTGAFWLFLDALGIAGLYILYIWSGVLTTLVLVHFWTLLGALFSVTQAKRLYGLIGTGSVLGAIVGSGAAGALAAAMDARTLLLVSSLGFACTSMVPFFFGPSPQPEDDEDDGGDGFLESASYVLRQPYARRVALYVVVSTVALTLADYLFKATAAAHVAPEALGEFFGTAYLIFNVLSLVCQVGLVSWVIRRFDLMTALAVLPALLIVGSVGFVAVPGITAALAIKATDGALKHSLHRTSTELMFVPLSDRSRARVKAFIDVVGQRGGQTVASVAVLLIAATRLDLAWVAAALGVIAVLWVLGTMDIRRFYVDVFRSRVRRGLGSEDFPELDVASLETLIATLDSDFDDEVVAALDVLERDGRTRLVPALILYHPAERVVTRALSLFVRASRTRALGAIDRLIEHPAPQVRAAAIAARAVLGPDEEMLRARLGEEEDPQVRATITVNLIAMGATTGTDAQEALEALIAQGSVQARIALAEAIGRRAAASFADTLVRLSEQGSFDVQVAAARAMAMAPLPVFFVPLFKLLGREFTRKAAQATLLSYGAPGYDALVAALGDDDLPSSIRRHVPRALCAFDAPGSVDILLAHLVRTESGNERYRVILALEAWVRRDPSLTLDASLVTRGIEANLGRAYRNVDRQLSLTRGAEDDPRRRTPGHDLLAKALADKRAHALGRAFRLLGLIDTSENYANIYRDATGADAAARANAMELLENLLRPPLRGEVVALVDAIPDRARLAAGVRLHTPQRLSYDALLEDLLAQSSTAIQDMAVFHIGEIGLVAFAERVRRMERAEHERGDIVRTLTLLENVRVEADVH